MEKKVSIGGHLNSSINFAMQQNYVPIIRNLVIKNESEEALSNLKLVISFEPNFAKDYTYDIEKIEAGQSIEISPVRIRLSTEFLFSLTEKMVGSIFVRLSDEEDTIYEYENSVELLAYDQWTGLLIMPELISAFVTPNHPLIAEVITKASEYLHKWTNSPAFTGYQTQNPNNVKQQMAAIYSALQARDIVYNNPPASFEVLGQRVRLPHAVLEQKQGTCLDLSVLYAACMEAVGLHPLIVFKRGHAFAGCWLEEQTFADCAEDDISALEKRTVQGDAQILLVECTDFTVGKRGEFEQALKHGKDHLHAIEEFAYAIDVKRGRGSGIRPIPVRLEEARLLENQEYGQLDFSADTARAPQDLQNIEMADLSNVEENLTKQKVWERKLLDFSLRNALLNFRVTKNALQLMTSDLGALEDSLADGKEFRVMEVPSEWTVSLRDAKMFEIETEKDLITNIAAEEFKSNRIRTFLPEEDLTKNLKSIYRSAKVSIEENGTNTLFLALGFLRWFETDLSEKPRYAPIVLVPVDIVKSHRNKGYVIRSRQEETQINITLLEYLKQIFGIKINGLDPLPTDEHGVDLPLVFHTVRQAIMGKNRWNIEDMAFVGLFSFGQFVMWNDIRNRSAELEKNKVVSSLIEGKMTWEPQQQTINADNLDKLLKPEQMAVPMSADSSQLVAIAAAASGESFVLHGPPGTGKSQTITNMIANALYQGKSVLFVAEKMAALNVVQNRLESIGLAPFCLEVHSNKSSKSSVLNQLNKSLEVGRIKAPEQYKETADRIFQIRCELGKVIEALHAKREYGCSLYEAIEKYEEGKDDKGKIIFPDEYINSVTAEEINNCEGLLRQLVVAIKEVGNYQDSPFKGYEGVEYSMELRDSLEKSLADIISMAERTKQIAEKLCQTLGIKDDMSKKVLDELVTLGRLLADSDVFLKKLLESQNMESVAEKIREICQDGIAYNNLKVEIDKLFEPQVYDYDVANAMMRMKQAGMSWFLPGMLGTNKLLKEMKLLAKNPAIITKDSISGYYDKLSNIKMLKENITKLPADITNKMEGLYLGTDTDWNKVLDALAKTYAVRDFVASVDAQKKQIYISGISDYSNNAEVRDSIGAIVQFNDSIEKFTSTYGINLEKHNDVADWLAQITVVFNNYRSNLNGLKNWVSVNQKSNQLKEAGLACVVGAWRKGRVNAEDIITSFETNLYYGLVLKTLREDTRLKGFTGRQYEDIIAQYEETIEKFRVLTIQELVSKLSANIPVSGTASAATSEIGILKRAIKSNGRMMSIRRLFDEIPTLLRKLCPCMLMSPISVAQYIDPSFPKFDLVIFDEASQLQTSGAVGTIARGENVIIVGDPKQLPPTSFFNTNVVDEENMEKEDLESLLDDCLSLSMPQEHLKWHYRSRHESLIAYSNMKYYDNKLYTFPSPNDLVSQVKLVPIEGFYDKGKTKQNKAEAKAVVDEIIRRLSDKKLRNDSIGVVTFSSVQQNLIDDMLAEAFALNPKLEEFNLASKEPVFIKNLENVQGDERDVILFSVGYGPDAQGKVSMNFGPLNREGGWRRLNVAISRARKEMVVYSTLRPEQIDLSRTRSEGVAGLKGFLEYADRGKSVLAARAGGVNKPADSLVLQLAKVVEALGYEVRCNIGCSEYRMDIGVVNPENPETYLLGILLDGENCYEAATARDRFVLQPGVLEGLGWNIIRIWTLDWLDNPQIVLQEIASAIDLSKKQLEERAEAERLAAEQADSETKSVEKINVAQEMTNETGIVFEREEISQESYKSAGATYKTFDIKPMGTPEDFAQSFSQTGIRITIHNIIMTEAPISRKALMRKVLSGWGISRSGSRVEASFEAALSNVVKKETVDNGNVFYWKPDQNPESYQGYRVEDDFGNKRSMDDITSYEITNAIKEVLNEQISLSKTDLVRETAKKFGFTRLGTVIEASVNNAMNMAVSRGIIIVSDNDKVTLA